MNNFASRFSMSRNNGIKIDKYIGHSGYTSRRKACELIDNGLVTVNGRTATFSTLATENDEIVIDGVKLTSRPSVKTFIAYNKPRGIICTTEKIEGNIVDAVNHPQRIYPVGRLDKESEGLILLTNQGEWIDKIANPANGHEKEYIVTLNLPVRKQFLLQIAGGVTIQGEKTLPCRAWPEPGTRRIFRIVLKQGLNRQIRRMCTAFGYQVIRLQRVRIMNIQLGKLKSGEWRDLTEEEITTLTREK
jgi:23S rRNA pseudouridine2604 synthase